MNENSLKERLYTARGSFSHGIKTKQATATKNRAITSSRLPQTHHVIDRTRDPCLRNKYDDARQFNVLQFTSLSAVK